ncbi:MAG: acyl-ACP--UDP-N-acetylglucosamine O-acyltransferase [Verrucomicrobia bacterium]|nr:MAG: acyl-ACP--UDP-N-acetylglucosamine O-acyltransferase [Verrucomicrobiota bacterium]
MQRIPNQPSPSPLHFVGRGDCMHAHSCFILPTVSMRDVKIHPTALVDPGARIGADVEVGPFSMIGPQAVIGNSTIVQSHVVIEGDVTIATGNFIGHGAIIGARPQDLSFSPDRKTKVVIGNDNVIREYCTIHRGSPNGSVTRIGNNNFLMAGAHIGHNCLIGNNVIIANNCLLAGHVRVDDGAFLGGGSTFHQFMHIGRLVMVQGSSAFGKDLPPFVIAAERNSVFGVNVVGLRRAGFSVQDRDELKAAFKLLYMSGLNISQALEKAAAMEFGAAAREFFAFVAPARKRGICPYKSGATEEM